MIQITLNAPTTEALELWAIQYLTDAGYSITKELYPVERRETPQRLARRLGVSASTLSTRLHAQDCPRHTRSAGKRIRWVNATPELEAFLKRHLHHTPELKNK